MPKKRFSDEQIAFALRQAESGKPTSSHLALLLKYAVYSALPDNSGSAHYQKRFELISALDSRDLEGMPIFLFDYALLSYQVGKYNLGNTIFQDLRKGRKFIDVPLERSRLLVSPDKPQANLQAKLIVRRVNEYSASWATFDAPKELAKLKIEVPFTKAEFERSSGVPVKAGSSLPANIRLRSAGPQAIPIRPYS